MNASSMLTGSLLLVSVVRAGIDPPTDVALCPRENKQRQRRYHKGIGQARAVIELSTDEFTKYASWYRQLLKSRHFRAAFVYGTFS